MEWNLLYDWQQLDREARQLAATAAQPETRKTIKALQLQFTREKETLAELVGKIKILEAAHKKIMEEVAVAIEEQDKQQDLLYRGEITNPKELQAIEENLAQKNKNMMVLNEEKESLVQEISSLQKKGVSLKKKLRAIQEKHSALKKELIEVEENFREKIAALSQEKEALWQKLSPESQQWFNKHAARDHAPISILKREMSCKHCGMLLPAAMIKQIKEIPASVRCEKCGKYLIAYGDRQEK